MNAQVDWWAVHTWVAEHLAGIDDWPMVGTAEWCDLDDTDPRKVAALFDAASHWALRVETCQTAMAQTSRDVSASTDWSAVANVVRRRREVYIPREVA